MSRRAGSLYRGFRVTLTEVPGSDACIVTLATKNLQDRWDEWSLLFPALRVPLTDELAQPALADMLSLAIAALERELRC